MTRNMSTEKRQPKGTPIGGQFAASARAESGVDLSTPAKKARKRTVVPPNEWYGWARGVEVVEVEVLQRGINGAYALQAVYADGTHIGYAVGRGDSKRRWWDYVLGTETPDQTKFPGMVFGNDSRQMTLSNLTDAAKREGLL